MGIATWPSTRYSTPHVAPFERAKIHGRAGGMYPSKKEIVELMDKFVPKGTSLALADGRVDMVLCKKHFEDFAAAAHELGWLVAPTWWGCDLIADFEYLEG